MIVPTPVELSISSSYTYSMSEGSHNSEIEQTQETNGVDHADMRFVYVITPLLVTGKSCLYLKPHHENNSYTDLHLFVCNY